MKCPCVVPLRVGVSDTPKFLNNRHIPDDTSWTPVTRAKRNVEGTHVSGGYDVSNTGTRYRALPGGPPAVAQLPDREDSDVSSRLTDVSKVRAMKPEDE